MARSDTTIPMVEPAESIAESKVEHREACIRGASRVRATRGRTRGRQRLVGGALLGPRSRAQADARSKRVAAETASHSRSTTGHPAGLPFARANATGDAVSLEVCDVFRSQPRLYERNGRPPSGLAPGGTVGLRGHHNLRCRDVRALDCCSRRHSTNGRCPGFGCRCGRRLFLKGSRVWPSRLVGG
jgi:hypothetical protein